MGETCGAMGSNSVVKLTRLFRAYNAAVYATLESDRKKSVTQIRWRDNAQSHYRMTMNTAMVVFLNRTGRFSETTKIADPSLLLPQGELERTSTPPPSMQHSPGTSEFANRQTHNPFVVVEIEK
jgi:hypothetical protein